MNNPPETRDDVISNDDNTNADINQDNEELIKNEYAERSILDTADEIINHDFPICDELGSGKQVYKCEECEARYKNKNGLYQHTRSKHEGIFYSCECCGYKATAKVTLKQHQESIHEGVKYSCKYCEFKATTQGNLKKHQESIMKV